MGEEPKIDFSVYLRHHFGRPSKMTWSYPIFVLAILTALFFTFRCIFKKIDDALPVTSLVGFALFSALFIVGTLVLPGISLSRGFHKQVIGRYSGIGTLLMSFISGLPMMLISTSLHNIGSYIWLRLGFKTVFPALFYFQTDGSIIEEIIAFLAETLIPAFGVSFFFFGVLWSRFRSKELFVGGFIVALVYTFWSLNPMMFLPTFLVATWCFYLRTTNENIWGPFICLISMKLMEFLFIGTLSKVDLLYVQTHSDIASTYLYASIPSLIFGMIILVFLRSSLLEFHNRHAIVEEEEMIDSTIPSFLRGVNFSIVVSLIIFVTIFILMCKGVHL